MNNNDDLLLFPVTARFICPDAEPAQRYAGVYRKPWMMTPRKYVEFALYEAGFGPDRYKIDQSEAAGKEGELSFVLKVEVVAFDAQAAIAKVETALASVPTRGRIEYEADEDEADLLEAFAVSATVDLEVWAHSEEDAESRARDGVVVPDPDMGYSAEIDNVVAVARDPGDAAPRIEGRIR